MKNQYIIKCSRNPVGKSKSKYDLKISKNMEISEKYLETSSNSWKYLEICVKISENIY